MERRPWKRWLRWLGLVLLLGFVLRRVDPAAIAAAWRGLGPAELAFVALAWGLSIGVRLLRWFLQAEGLGYRFHPRALARGWLWGMLLGLVTPAKVGELYRLGALQGGSRLRAAAAVAYEKAAELVTLVGVAAAGAAFAGIGWLAGVGAAGTVVGGAMLLSRRLPPAGMAGPLARFTDPVFAARDDLPWRRRLGVLAASLAAHLLNIAAGALLYRAFGDVAWGKVFFGMPVVTLVAAVPVTISGVGLRESAAMQIFGVGGYPASAAALVAATAFFGANVLPVLVALGAMELFGARGDEAPPEA